MRFFMMSLFAIALSSPALAAQTTVTCKGQLDSGITQAELVFGDSAERNAVTFSNDGGESLELTNCGSFQSSTTLWKLSCTTEDFIYLLDFNPSAGTVSDYYYYPQVNLMTSGTLSGSGSVPFSCK